MGDARVAEVPEFVCPRDHGVLAREASSLVCTRCSARYPIVRDIPVFICDERSVFAVADYAEENGEATTAQCRLVMKSLQGAKKADAALAGRLANVMSSVKRPSYLDAIKETMKRRGTARVLVIGSGGRPYEHPSAKVVCTDVAFAPHVNAIVDAHDLPFADQSFDLAIAVAVLEHVADPARCVHEIWRVLAPRGVVFAVTPFLEPVHMGAWDFTRFTPIGHRRLFRWFTTIDEGVAGGAGTMFGYALTGFLVSLWGNRLWRNVANLAGLFAAVPLKKLDKWMARLPSRDNASGCYFVGERHETPISDRELIGMYEGGFSRAHK